MALDASERDRAAHITGDYYYLDDTPAWAWGVAAVTCLPPLTPIGAFLIAYFVVGAIRREDDLDDGLRPAVRRVDS